MTDEINDFIENNDAVVEEPTEEPVEEPNPKKKQVKKKVILEEPEEEEKPKPKRQVKTKEEAKTSNWKKGAQTRNELNKQNALKAKLYDELLEKTKSQSNLQTRTQEPARPQKKIYKTWQEFARDN